AAERKVNIKFETMNAARESIGSTDIEAIVREEVVPLRPDLVIYYEGGNQFRLDSLVPDLPRASPRDTAELPPGRLAFWLQQTRRYSALARRLQAATGSLVRPVNANVEETTTGFGLGSEWHKPAYTLVWPQGLDEHDP